MLVGLGQMMVFKGEDNDELSGFELSRMRSAKDLHHGVG
jgi:hypothetical protein